MLFRLSAFYFPEIYADIRMFLFELSHENGYPLPTLSELISKMAGWNDFCFFLSSRYEVEPLGTNSRVLKTRFKGSKTKSYFFRDDIFRNLGPSLLVSVTYYNVIIQNHSKSFYYRFGMKSQNIGFQNIGKCDKSDTNRTQIEIKSGRTHI